MVKSPPGGEDRGEGGRHTDFGRTNVPKIKGIKPKSGRHKPKFLDCGGLLNLRLIDHVGVYVLANEIVRTRLQDRLHRTTFGRID